MAINLLPGDAIEANTITTTQMNSDAWAEVYAALATANAAYAQANAATSAAAGGVSLGLVIALS